MIKRFLHPLINEALQDTPVITISGTRQMGKSTFCKQLQENGIFNGNYLTLDDATILDAVQRDPLGFFNGYGK